MKKFFIIIALIFIIILSTLGCTSNNSLNYEFVINN